ncbi:PRC-barrel domain-containing protein [Rhizobium helianthi]|uniref:PRC-barrel domain-containing protein n=1 Tax=Rhizobium helianthi TaxID=1132695 RepID=A0ABW4M2H8_9HYPH
MTKKLIAALALSTVLPFAAMAQTTTAPVTPEQGQATNQNNARGGMADVPRSAEATTEGPFVTVPGQGAWKVSDLRGKSVYTTGGESIGSISDVLVSQDGSVNAVILGVGGFLGINEKDVAVDMSALQLGPGMTQKEADQAAANTPAVSGETTASTANNTSNPVPSANTTNGVGMGAQQQNTAAGQGTAAPARNEQMAANNSGSSADAKIGEDGLPERIVLNVTREQLDQAPAFQGMTPAR